MTSKETAPLTNFTFWPYNNEVDLLAQSDVPGLADMIQTTNFSVQVFHELWRTQRDQEAMDLTRECFTRSIQLADVFFDNAPTCLATAQFFGNVSPDEHGKFLTHTWTLMTKELTHTPLTGELSPHYTAEITELVSLNLRDTAALYAKMQNRLKSS